MANFDSANLLAKVTGIRPDIAGDTFIQVPTGDKQIVITQFFFYCPTGGLAASTSSVAVYTRANRAGTAIMTVQSNFLQPLASTATVIEAVSTGVIPFAVVALSSGGFYVNISTPSAPSDPFSVYIRGFPI